MSLNREAWIQTAVSVLRQGAFASRGITIPPIKLSVGLPHARNQREIQIQYFPPDMSTDHTACVFVSPLLSDGSLIIGQLYNMLREIYAPLAHHLPLFTPALADDFLTVLGPYPHGALKLPEVATQSTRMLKLECSSCGYAVSTTLKWLARGTPTCYCGSAFKQVERKARKKTA